jgi:hypothetical protein
MLSVLVLMVLVGTTPVCYTHAVLCLTVYAFGILMWEILTCRLPFEGMTYREMMEVCGWT